MSFNPHQQMALGLLLNDGKTFDSYYQGPNAQVIDAIQSLFLNGQESFMYLWGAEGAGCTHLLQAACCQRDQYGRGAMYLPLKEVLNLGPDILDGLDACHLICIDDIQLICGKKDWEEGIFNLFNRLRDKGAKLLVGADRAPRQLPVSLPDLKSRLTWGVVLQVKVLPDDDKLKALQLRAKIRGLMLDEDAGKFILHRGVRNMGDLFDLLDKLDVASLKSQRKLTIPFIKETLKW